MLMNILPIAIIPLADETRSAKSEVKSISISSHAPVSLHGSRISKRFRHCRDLEVLERDLCVREIRGDIVVVRSESRPLDRPHQIKVHGFIEVIEFLAPVRMVFAVEVAEVGKVLVVLKDLLLCLRKLRIVVLARCLVSGLSAGPPL